MSYFLEKEEDNMNKVQFWFTAIHFLKKKYLKNHEFLF